MSIDRGGPEPGCWWCMRGKTKLRIIRNRFRRREDQEHREYARGGLVNPARIYRIGERGPEILCRDDGRNIS